MTPFCHRAVIVEGCRTRDVRSINGTMRTSAEGVGSEYLPMTLIRGLSIVGLVVMATAIAVGFVTGSFFEEGSEIWGLPWGKVTLIDLYVGLAFVAAWIAFRERSAPRTAAWWVGLIFLGNLAVAAYLVVASFSAKDVGELLTGDRA
jgi:hypothetical protein